MPDNIGGSREEQKVSSRINRFKRVAVFALSAGELVSTFDVKMFLADGEGIGWTLAGTTTVEQFGEVGLECPPDPDVRLCSICVREGAPSDSIDRLLDHFDLTREAALQTFE